MLSIDPNTQSLLDRAKKAVTSEDLEIPEVARKLVLELVKELEHECYRTASLQDALDRSPNEID